MPKHNLTEADVRLKQALAFCHARFILPYQLPVEGRHALHFAAMVYGKDNQPFGLIDYEGTFHTGGPRQELKKSMRGHVMGMGRWGKERNRERMYYCFKSGIRYYRVYRNAELDAMRMGLVRWLRLGWGFGRTYDSYHAEDDFISAPASLDDLRGLQDELERWKSVMDWWEVETPHVPTGRDGTLFQRHKPVPPVWKLERA